MSYGRIFYIFASITTLMAAFIFVSPSLVNNNFITPDRIDSTYLAYHVWNDPINLADEPVLFRPSQLGLSYEQFSIFTKDSLELSAWYVAARDTPTNTIVIIHDINQSKLLYLDQLKQFHDRGLNVCIFDMRAHGSSEGREFSPGIRETDDLKIILQEAQVRTGSGKLVLMGLGIGALVAAQAAKSDSTYGALVLENPVRSLEDYLDRYAYRKWGIWRYLWNPIFDRKVEKLLGQRLSKLDLVKLIPTIDKPILFLCGSEDSLVFTSETMQIFQASTTEKKELFLIEKAGHSNMAAIGGEKYYNKICAFINVNIPKDLKRSRFKKMALK